MIDDAHLRSSWTRLSPREWLYGVFSLIGLYLLGFLITAGWLLAAVILGWLFGL